MSIVDVENWVEATDNNNELVFRQAAHTVLVAVSNSAFLNQRMYMKGGILLSLIYNGIRHTRDIDFSTSQKVSGFDEGEFLEELKRELASAVESLPYGLDCRIQSHEMRPPATAGHTQPTYKIKIGYAYKGDKAKHKRLLNGRSPAIVEVDYSFNEPNYEHTAEVELDNGGHILVYSLIDLLAEKIRSILQQEARNRVRRQDAYDLYCLLEQIGELSDARKNEVLNSLLLKAEARALEVNKGSMNNPEIRKRSEAEYKQLESEIEGELPSFEVVYERVTRL
ncbi:nucleotidyl transferase AbiEii/AbiGii toxin family protein [Thiohalophilus sp.]|uniref:nucleotidyl transferase AbiEii/AbiGii toxin family protein n=1 Tax=Thiohalophilus sp. TaxID=3028392 RepID=UPI002ACE2A77|nr:nucleotidyl transferase AbiEii/AbiGii toxin family protein [Thiohalophilus sp.]MDZ7661060.1 nucleotidyl transferase AbiEii/AbiGii toxin family protein [Thiohalophilus sp.]